MTRHKDDRREYVDGARPATRSGVVDTTPPPHYLQMSGASMPRCAKPDRVPEHRS